MSQYYNPKRTFGIFSPNSGDPFKLSRSKIDLFLECPRCFYLDRRLGVARPPGFPFTLNSAVDTLLKKEFDIHRAKGEAHPMMKHYGVEAVPFQHEKMNDWRNTFMGIQYLHQPTNLLIFGAIDDIWIDPQGELIIVDYKATAKNGEINLDADWQMAYKRQMEIYQWLFRKNGFKVSDTGYFVYVNGKTDREAFDGKLEFDVYLIPYQGDDSWIEKTIGEIHQCLINNQLPESSKDCVFCRYRQTVKGVENNLKDGNR
jgi:CRISPR/Cas system-associated exonuclease Cas4 (RecB family)